MSRRSVIAARKAAASGTGPTSPEPKSDIRAQTAAMLDQSHPKDAVFVARGTPEPAALPDRVKRVSRPEGTLVTTNAKKAAAFARGVDDRGMARLLGLPQPKSDVMQLMTQGHVARVIQAQDRRGNVVTETAAAGPGVAKARKVLAKHVPAGGKLVTTTLGAAHVRRGKQKGTR